MPSQVNSGGGADLIASYFLLPSEQSYLVANGWTLRFEFLFYFVFMLGLLLNRKLGNTLVIAVLLLMVGFGIWKPSSGIWGDFLTNSLLLEFAFGMLLYHSFERLKQLPSALLMVFIGIGIGALLAVNQGVNSNIRVIDFGIPMLFIMAGVLGIEQSLQKYPIAFFKVLGDTSYAMYLIHPFALAGGAMVLSKLGLSHFLGGWFFVLVLLIGSLLAGYLLYQWVEKPIAKLLKKRSDATKPKQTTVEQPLRGSI
jgi:peptidoglycan/LPS O-acetylase OafA/YrhL